jgi:murein DD-endopeptidase MepM/ murein hydrolase activator NlpD
VFTKLPCEGVISQGFHAGHRALDIDNVTGTEIRNEWAAGRTIVQWTIDDDGDWNPDTQRNGNCYVLRHEAPDGQLACVSQYMHLRDKPALSPGTELLPGEVLGYMGNTGKVRPAPAVGDTETGSHLHWMVRMYGDYARAHGFKHGELIDGRRAIWRVAPAEPPPAGEVSPPMEVADLQELWLHLEEHPAEAVTPSVARVEPLPRRDGFRVYEVRIKP